MLGKLSPALKWSLRKAWKSGLKASAMLEDQQVGDVLLVFPPDPDWVYAMRRSVLRWLEETSAEKTVVLIPRAAWDILDAPETVLEKITYSPLEIRKNGLPQKPLLERVAELEFHAAALVSDGVDPLSEVLFARVPAKLKAALWNPLRANKVQLLVQPKEDAEPVHAGTLLLNQFAHFAL